MRLIDADALMEKLNGIWDCNDMTFAPVDGCCIDADCKSCRWRETIEYVKRLVQNQTTASPWHRVEDGLPNEFDTVIVCGRMKYDYENDYEVFVDAAEYGPYSPDRWVTWNDWHEGQEEFKITHWMPLPEPPKEDA